MATEGFAMTGDFALGMLAALLLGIVADSVVRWLYDL